MKKSHIIKILGVFSEKEIREFSNFIRSPFFNKNESVVRLFDYVRKYYPDFPDDKLEKEKVYAKLFHGTQYNDAFMRKIMFSLSGLAEAYLAHNGFFSNKPAVQDMLMQQYLSRGSAALFKKTHKDTTAIMKSDGMISAERFYYSYLCSYRNLAFSGDHKSVDFSKFTAKNDLFETFELISVYFLLSLMALYEYYLNTQRMLKLDVDYGYFENIINSFDKKLIPKYPLLKIHYNMVKMLTEPAIEEHFIETKKLIQNNEHIIEKADLGNMYINLQNYCMRKIRGNHTKYSGELLKIYKLDFQEDFPAKTGISLVHYRNIVFTSLQENEIDFAENFTEQYMKYMPEETRESVYFYSKAHIALKRKDFENMSKYLSRVKSIDELLKADMKSMMIIMYYETKAYAQLHSLFDTFKHYVKDNSKFSDERMKIYNTFINFSVRLSGILEKYDAQKINKLENDIMESENVINKNWLLEKINELKKDNA